MLVVICVIGTVVIQAVIALFIAKFIQAGKGPRMMEAVKEFRKSHAKAPEPAPAPAFQPATPRAAIDNYADLAALLEALSPTPEEKTALLDPEETVPAAVVEPRLPGTERQSGRD